MTLPSQLKHCLCTHHLAVPIQPPPHPPNLTLPLSRSAAHPGVDGGIVDGGAGIVSQEVLALLSRPLGVGLPRVGGVAAAGVEALRAGADQVVWVHLQGAVVGGMARQAGRVDL